MQAFDPSIIKAEPVQTEQGLRVNLTATGIKGTAYYRIPPEFRDFLKKCHDEHGIAGFDYDFEAADLNFGVILKETKEIQ